jgi:peroxygenase
MKASLSAIVLAGLSIFSAASARAACPSIPLELHAGFFDRNHDGKVELDETLEGLEKLGMGYVERHKFAYLLHTVVFFKNGGDSAISVAGIAKTGRHEGDSGIFNKDGAYDAAAFERFFDRFDADRSGALNAAEVEAAIAANKKERGAKGSGAAAFELPVLIRIAGDRADTVKGASVKAISKERLRKFYQGTLFYELTGEPVPACVAELRPTPESAEFRNFKVRLADGLPTDWDQVRP